MNEEVVDTINEVRGLFLDSVARLPELQSFGALLHASASVRQGFEQALAAARSPRIEAPCVGRFTCAIIGSSGHGKTTILDEMFPSLSSRGWLVTDVTDTTSQSLRIEYAPVDDPNLREVTVNSWSADQIKGLLQHPEVEAQNETDAIRVQYLENGAVIDGGEAAFARDDLKQFRFPRKMDLTPFAAPYRVTKEQSADPRFIRALTVKEPSSVLKTEPILSCGGRRYDALQLRAIVKDVTLKDPFENVVRWSGRAADSIRHLTIVDTPGLATPGNVKDEVLRHFLERKSNHIALELWRNDELDIVVHMVLAGRSSDFATLWKDIERQCGPAEMESLSERLVLVVNGMNIYFTNRDLKARWQDAEATARDGDPFAATVEDNILQKMSPRGSVRPAKTCFVDSRSIVETQTAGDYASFYGRMRPVMRDWTEPGGVGHDTLKRLGMLEAFKENVDALCDPDDRGQGLLVRRLCELIDEKGPWLLLRKHVVRPGLLERVTGLKEVLRTSYDDDGNLNREAIKEALRSCLSFLDPHDLSSIERFCVARVDDDLQGAIPARDASREPSGWVENAYFSMCGTLRTGLLMEAEAAGVPGEIAEEFFRHFDGRVSEFVERFGYKTAKLVPPDKGFASTRDLVLHCLRIHAREILYQLLTHDSDDGDGDGGGEHGAIHQSADDREQVKQVLLDLERAEDLARRACARFGVGS